MQFEIIIIEEINKVQAKRTPSYFARNLATSKQN